MDPKIQNLYSMSFYKRKNMWRKRDVPPAYSKNYKKDTKAKTEDKQPSTEGQSYSVGEEGSLPSTSSDIDKVHGITINDPKCHKISTKMELFFKLSKEEAERELKGRRESEIGEAQTNTGVTDDLHANTNMDLDYENTISAGRECNENTNDSGSGVNGLTFSMPTLFCNEDVEDDTVYADSEDAGTGAATGGEAAARCRVPPGFEHVMFGGRHLARSMSAVTFSYQEAMVEPLCFSPFMRGRHEVPHSSNIDVTPMHTGLENFSPCSLAEMPPGGLQNQLVHAVSAVTMIQNEITKRNLNEVNREAMAEPLCYTPFMRGRHEVRHSSVMDIRLTHTGLTWPENFSPCSLAEMPPGGLQNELLYDAPALSTIRNEQNERNFYRANREPAEEALTYTTFMRGIHDVPHSSVMDIPVMVTGPQEFSSYVLAELSPRRLATIHNELNDRNFKRVNRITRSRSFSFPADASSILI